MKLPLKLPGHLTFTTLGVALALSGVACGDDGSPLDASARLDAPGLDAPPADAPPGMFFCEEDPFTDSGGMFDGAVCGVSVDDPADCPPGCIVLAG